MDMWVLHGSDDEALTRRRGVLLAGAGQEAERIDLAEDGPEALFAALESYSLFQDRRVVCVENADVLSETDALRIAGCDSDAYVVMRAESLTAAVTKILANTATIEKFTTAKGRQVGARVKEIAEQHGLVLAGDVERLLTGRAGHDLHRVASICTQLSLAGITKPTRAQVTVLLGTCAPDGVPWGVTDALEQRDIAGAIKAAEGLEPMSVLAYLTNQITLAAAVSESPSTDPQHIQSAFGVTPFAAGKAAWWVRALGGNLRTALGALAEADKLAKSQVGGADAVALALGRIGSLL